jgi:tetratricopeptide (TPR) repeat protein
MTRACALAVFLVLPATASAQKDAFIGAVIEFHSALSGTYGDEGARVEAALDRMAVALEAWNTENRKTEAALRSGPDAAWKLAQFFADTGRQDKALEAIEIAIRLEPERPGLYTFRGALLDAAGRDEDALASFQRAWALDPDDPLNAYLLAARLSSRRPPEPPERQMAVLLAAYTPAGSGSAAKAPFIQTALIADSVSIEPRFTRPDYADGFAALASGRYEEAIGLFRVAMARDPLVTDRVARSGRAANGVAALRQDQVTDAVSDLEAAVASAPSSSEACRLLGVAHALAGNVDASLKWLAEAIRLVPTDERARVAIGRVLIGAGRVEEAERALLDTIRLMPAAGRARWALADLYENTGRATEAIDQLEEAATLTMVAGKAGLLWRLANLVRQDPGRLVSALTRRIPLMPNDPYAHRSLGLAYHLVGRDVEALVELLIASRLGLEDAQTLTAMGEIHLGAGRLAQAETVLRRAVATAPGSDTAHYALASTLLRLGKTEEAGRHLAEFRRMQETLLEQTRRKYERDLQERNERLQSEKPAK